MKLCKMCYISIERQFSTDHFLLKGFFLFFTTLVLKVRGKE